MKGLELGLGLLKGLGFWRVRVTGRVFGRVRVRVSFRTSAIMKLPKYGKICVVFEGILCHKFVTIWLILKFFAYS